MSENSIKISKHHLCIALSITLLASCAKAPERISPALIANDTYLEDTCDDLVSETSRIDKELGVLMESQKKAARVDLLAVIIVGVPVTWMYKGNKAKQIGHLKGEILAIEDVALKQGCALPAHIEVQKISLEASEGSEKFEETWPDEVDD